MYDQSEKNHSINKEIRFKTSMLRSDLCDFGDAHIVVKGNIIVVKKAFRTDDIVAPNNTAANVTATNDANNNAFGEKNLVFKNNAPFINCISKTNGTEIDNAEDLDFVMPMYNLLEYSKNYRKTTGSLWNYYRDEPSSTDNNNITHSIFNSKSFDYKANFIANNNLIKNDVKIVVPLKHLSNFWRHLDILLINCEVELILTWFKNCVLIDKITRNANYNADPIVYEINNPEDATFQITDTKLYVPVITLSKENNIKLLEQFKTRFKRTIKWNKYRSQMSIKNNNSNLNYLIDSTFTNVHRLFVLSFERTEDHKEYRDSFSYCYVPKVKIKDFNVLINGKSFFDLPIKNEEEAYKKIIDMSNNNYTTGNLLDFAYYKENY